MKLLKTASGKTRIKMSKKEWIEMGGKAGWLKQSSDQVASEENSEENSQEENIVEGSLWENIRKKRERGEKPAKKGDPDYPDQNAWDKAVNSSDELELIRQAARFDGLVVEAAEYQGKEVKLNKPMRGDVKKYKVYVKNDKGNVVKVNFGDKNMEIKRDDPERRKSFRARHNCDNPGPKWKARYWSCKFWSTKSVSDLLKG